MTGGSYPQTGAAGGPTAPDSMEGVEVSSDLRDVAVQLVQAMQETPAGVAQKWASIIANLCADG